eukprot:TRINITY_DN54623_c0_g2_i1.p1 TRINITY_DN54623_c0_g2~~TRINITY_DN54623_c0_g2_i1.p1  ORF type:complete len:477 (+),score=173.16 TRINITY_DN54623_c0_g2_i1:147-1433(+)
MTQGNVGQWNKKVGDKVSPGESLVAIETDKATVDFEAQDEGYLAKIIVQQGASEVQIGTLLGYMVDELEEVANIDQNIPKTPAAAAAVAATPPPAAAQPIAAPAAAAAPAPKGVKATSITPAALFHLSSNNIDPESVSATGPGGRMLKGDVLAAIKNGSAKKLPEQQKKTSSALPVSVSSETAEASKPAVESVGRRGERGFTDIPLTNMRKVIATRLTESKRTIPHAFSTAECTMDELLSLRKMLKEKLGANASVNDFIIKAAALALRDVPEANSFYDPKSDSIKKFPTVDISVAVATDSGLITPIVKNADKKGISEISSNVKDLAGRARIGKLKPDEFQGGSFTISNLGMFGVTEFSAIINPPQACILAVGTSMQRTMFNETTNSVEPTTTMKVTISADRRVVDEAIAEKYLVAFKKFLETPTALLL